ncbi:PBS lyase [Streptomyces sp. CAU 1734]|uniref:PBS lyase n=1 Tax=Streptomyces sp. CAU 1734 TaxID=3140360 RepID=UPI0032606320
MFEDINEVGWAGLEHAYGPAEDVPELLRGLASGDPAEREAALDGMYGAVHHQGDVYDSTLACIPFLLELVADPSVRDRGGIVELLTSIGGIDLDGDDELDLEGEEFEYAANYAMAASAVTAGADVFLALIDDADRGVRLTAPLALATLHGEPELVLGLLRERLRIERDPEVRFACVEAGGRIALRHQSLAPEVVEWLIGLTRLPKEPGPYGGGTGDAFRHDGREGPGGRGGRDTGDGDDTHRRSREDGGPGAFDHSAGFRAAGAGERPPGAGERPPAGERAPGEAGTAGRNVPTPERPQDGADRPRPYDAGLRLSALAQLARCAPQTLPPDVVPAVMGLLRELRAEPGGAVPPAERQPPPAPAPAVQRREHRGSEAAGRHAPWTGDLLRALHSGLGDRVGDRISLLADQLCSPDRGQRIDAVRMSTALMRTWRGGYGELVVLIGEQLTDKELRLSDAAAAALGELFGLALPAADALAEFVEGNPGVWAQEWASGPRMLGSAVAALARTGDARAVPVLGRMLEMPEAPQDLGYALDHLGAAAAPLAPALRRRLARTELDDRLYDVAGPLLYGLTALRATEALPEVLRVLRGAPEYRREWVLEQALRALAAFGPAAREAVPELRELLARAARSGPQSAAFAAKAAAALWAVEGEAGAVLPTLRWTLSAADSGARRAAASVLGTMGPAAWETAPELGVLLRAADPWTRVDAAIALWRVTGSPQRAWPVLMSAWETAPFTRVPTAERLAECSGGSGSGRAEGADRLLWAELSRVRRHNAIDGGYGSHDIVRDERLLALCRRALTRERSTE